MKVIKFIIASMAAFVGLLILDVMRNAIEESKLDKKMEEGTNRILVKVIEPDA